MIEEIEIRRGVRHSCFLPILLYMEYSGIVFEDALTEEKIDIIFIGKLQKIPGRYSTKSKN